MTMDYSPWSERENWPYVEEYQYQRISSKVMYFMVAIEVLNSISILVQTLTAFLLLTLQILEVFISLQITVHSILTYQ